jgi:glycosyltransferase involved in cell wall biosynthesis
MKVLHIINSLQGGGAEPLTLQIHELSLQRDIDSHVVGLLQSEAAGIPNTFSLGLETPYSLVAIKRLRDFLRQSQWKDVDILHIHLFPSQIIAPIVAHSLGLKGILITTEHSTSNQRRQHWWGKWIDRITYQFYQKIVCISEGTANALEAWQPAAAHKLTIIHNGIPIQNYRSALTQKSDQPVTRIISVGRLVKLKNYETAILALDRLKHHSFEYWIVGTGILEAPLKALVKSLNLESKVKFLGFRKDVPELLQQADIFLQTSLWEGFGLAAVEAMATGLPVVTSNVPGLREVVGESEQAGFLIDPNSQDQIAAKLNMLISNPALRHQMGMQACDRASHFNITDTVNQYLQLYANIC